MLANLFKTKLKIEPEPDWKLTEEEIKNTKKLELRGKYVGFVTKVYDADTCFVSCRCFDGVYRISCRLLACDSPEIRSKVDFEKALAYDGRDVAKGWLLGKYVTINAQGSDKYGRTLCDLTFEHGGEQKDYVTMLLKHKLVLPYDGKAKASSEQFKQLAEQRRAFVAAQRRDMAKE